MKDSHSETVMENQEMVMEEKLQHCGKLNLCSLVCEYFYSSTSDLHLHQFHNSFCPPQRDVCILS